MKLFNASLGCSFGLVAVMSAVFLSEQNYPYSCRAFDEGPDEAKDHEGITIGSSAYNAALYAVAVGRRLDIEAKVSQLRFCSAATPSNS